MLKQWRRSEGGGGGDKPPPGLFTIEACMRARTATLISATLLFAAPGMVDSIYRSMEPIMRKVYPDLGVNQFYNLHGKGRNNLYSSLAVVSTTTTSTTTATQYGRYHHYDSPPLLLTTTTTAATITTTATITSHHHHYHQPSPTTTSNTVFLTHGVF